MKYLYYCNSTYQLINILNLHWNRKYNSYDNIENYSADLIILNAFESAKDIVTLIKENEIFDNVFLVNRIRNYGKLHLIDTIFDIVFPKRYIKKIDINSEYFNNNYEVIITPRFSRNVAAIWQINKSAKLHLLEDGTATYMGTIELYGDSKIYKFLYKLLNKNKDFNDYERLYINYPELCIEENNRMIKMPSFTKTMIEKMRKTFSEYCSITKDEINKNIYYFGQYNFDKTISKINDSLEKESVDKLVYYPHPRYRNKNEMSYKTTIEKQIWELKASTIKNIENKYLLSIHSTACLTPKLLFNLEPNIILLYKLVDNSETKNIDSFDKFFSRYVKIYNDSSKIYIPKTYDELNEILANIQ